MVKNIKRVLFFYILITKYQRTEIFELFIITTLFQIFAITFFAFMWNATLDMLDKNLNTSFCSGMKMYFIFPLAKFFSWGNSLHYRRKWECLHPCALEILAHKNFVGVLVLASGWYWLHVKNWERFLHFLFYVIISGVLLLVLLWKLGRILVLGLIFS